MSTASLEFSTSPPCSSVFSGPMLVCASPAAGERDPQVSLADGVYVTEKERVFWRGDPGHDVLRVLLETPVSTRSTHRLPQRRETVTVDGGERALLKAVLAAQGGAPRRSPSCAAVTGLDLARSTLRHELSEALEDGDAELAYALAIVLCRQAGVAAVYQQLSQCLAALGSGWAAGTGTVLAEHRATRTAVQVTDRLASLSGHSAQCGTVVLAVPEGEAHTLVLGALAHLLRDAGRAVQVVDALPHRELMELAAAPGTIAVVLSVHTALPGGALRSLLRDLRAAGPELLLAVGGPGLPVGTGASLGANLVGDDTTALLTALDGGDSALSAREAEVLRAVADGFTNSDIARLLGVAPATVKSHLDKIFAKTGTEHRAAAVARALRRGWIS